MKTKWYHPIVPCILGYFGWLWFLLFSFEPQQGVFALFFLLWWRTENIQLQIDERK